MTSTDRARVLALVRERWVLIVLVVLAITFVVQNRNRVDLNLFWLHVDAPLWLVMATMTGAGAAIGWLASGRRRR